MKVEKSNLWSSMYEPDFIVVTKKIKLETFPLSVPGDGIPVTGTCKSAPNLILSKFAFIT